MVLSFSLAGTSVIAVRFIAGIGAFTITACSLLIALLAFAPFYRTKIIESVRQMNQQDWILMVLQAFFGIFLFRAFLLFGLRHTSTAEAGILIGSEPVLTCLFVRFILREKAGKKMAAGILCAVIGIILLQGIQLMELSFSGLLGNLLVLCAAASGSFFTILSRIHSAHKTPRSTVKLDPVVQSLLVAAIAFALCLLPALFEHPFSSMQELHLQGWLSIGWYGLVVTMLAYILWYAGIKRCSAYTAAAYSSLMPLTSMLLSYLLLRETITGAQWVGGCLVILGILAIAGLKPGEKQAG